MYALTLHLFNAVGVKVVTQKVMAFLITFLVSHMFPGGSGTELSKRISKVGVPRSCRLFSTALLSADLGTVDLATWPC